ncbi:MAG: hypothetical protein GY771_03220 [bacterium]|nr:hypothetical protein [bacterium]
MAEARKISFEEAWETSTVFFVNDELEDEIDGEVELLLETAEDGRVANGIIGIQGISLFIQENEYGLKVILKDIGLSEEKFMRIVSLLRKIGRVPGGFDKEWSINKISKRIREDNEFANLITTLLINGVNDRELVSLIPRYYLEMLNYAEIAHSNRLARKIRYKSSLIGTYGGRKGYYVEKAIERELNDIKNRYGVTFKKGRSRLIDTNVDFSIPNLDDPWVIIMSSFQETTSSGQTTKAKDMFNAHLNITRSNSRNMEDRAFVNFIDGGGWLARKADFRRLVDQCSYFVNLNHLNMLEAVILKHCPRQYINRNAGR